MSDSLRGRYACLLPHRPPLLANIRPNPRFCNLVSIADSRSQSGTTSSPEVSGDRSLLPNTYQPDYLRNALRQEQIAGLPANIPAAGAQPFAERSIPLSGSWSRPRGVFGDAPDPSFGTGCDLCRTPGRTQVLARVGFGTADSVFVVRSRCLSSRKSSSQISPHYLVGSSQRSLFPARCMFRCGRILSLSLCFSLTRGVSVRRALLWNRLRISSRGLIIGYCNEPPDQRPVTIEDLERSLRQAWRKAPLAHSILQRRCPSKRLTRKAAGRPSSLQGSARFMTDSPHKNCVMELPDAPNTGLSRRGS